MFIGILLIALGVAGVAFQGISYTTHERVIDIGGNGMATDSKTFYS